MADIFLTHTPDARATYYGERALAGLRALGSVRLNEADHPLSTAELLEASQGCRIIVSDRATFGEAALFDRHPTLQAFLRCAVDIRTIDVEAASRNGILVTRATPGFGVAVAELILGLMIDLARGISDNVLAYRSGQSQTIRIGRQLRGATLGIVGYGTIGRLLGEMAQALGMELLIHDPYLEPGASVGFQDLLAASDMVVCLAPATAETANMFGAAAFAAMKPSAYFINAARGDLVDEQALIDALDRKLIAGAAMDVGRALDQMPSPLLAGRADVIATPHIGGLTREATEHQAMDTVGQVGALLSGSLPLHAVNTESAFRIRRLLP
ncbi:NAD(P)-dependent oxidoreductase [Lacibacterium aquatile]|uniref:NAD(P)-dependent oxidoreductase n=1 Tax=Lacibacterium aquatile TaxID=1168082 RepID=A0ABW5DM16_9PROT